MNDKRQATTGAWVAPQPEQIQATQRQPTYKGETSGLRFVWLFALAFFVALAVAVVAWELWHMMIVSFGLFAISIYGVFVPVYRWDMEVSTGLRHRRMELRAEDYKSQDAVAIATAAATVNNEQQVQIEQLWNANRLFDERLKAVEVYRVQDRKGVREIPRHDEFDMAIDGWLAQFMFDANGVLVGSYPAGHIKKAFPFTAKDERGRQCFARLTTAGLIGKAGNNYTWTGPKTLTETQQKLAPGRGRMVPEID
jgi:hypothetical protein